MTGGLGKHMAARASREAILAHVVDERGRQDQKWGEQNHDPIMWCAILGEEVGEVTKAALDASMYSRPDVPEKFDVEKLRDYRAELIQVAAVAVAMVECLDRETWNNKKEK